MQPFSHAVIWIDHHEARIISFNSGESEEHVVHASDRTRHLHSKAGSHDRTPAREESQFFQEVCGDLGQIREILVTGPANAKTELVKHMHLHAPALLARLAGVETLDRVTDPQLLAEARRHFAAYDRMHPQTL